MSTPNPESRLVKFATQVDAATLDALRTLAHTQGRQVQTLVGEALSAYLHRAQEGGIRPDILAALQTSQTTFGSVYKALVNRP